MNQKKSYGFQQCCRVYKVSIKVTAATSVDISAVHKNLSMNFYAIATCIIKYALYRFIKIYLKMAKTMLMSTQVTGITFYTHPVA